MIPCIAYVRKSLDRSDRQVMSIDGQINEIKRLAERNGYHIIDILIEHKSAKKPGRPIFNQMIEKIQQGEATFILCWKLNRLARNPIDAGTLSWLLQCNLIHAIHSCERSYLPTDNVLMMQIDFGIANQFIKDLSSDVRRGLRDKANDGWNPQSNLPIGYLHHPEKQNAQEQIIIDPIRFPIIKELWRLIEIGAYSVIEIKRMADRMGLLNKRQKPYSLNTFYLLFQNPMYYGKFYWKDENRNRVLRKGKHQPMITELSFRKVQTIIAHRNQKMGVQTYVYTYRGLITCGGCNGHVTAERKLQAICTRCKHKYSIKTNEVCTKCGLRYSEMIHPSVIDITYYRCTWKKDPRCRQKSISETEIERRILEVLSQINISEEMYDWVLKHIDSHIKHQHSDDGVLLDSLRRKKDKAKEKLRNLIDLHVSGDIDKAQVEALKDQYKNEIEQVESEMFTKEHAIDIATKEHNDYLSFAKNCVQRFKNGDQRVKKELTAFFCSNLILMDKSLYFSTKKAPFVLSSMQYLLLPDLACSNLK